MKSFLFRTKKLKLKNEKKLRFMAVGAAIIILLLTEITQQLLDSLPRSPRCSWCPEDEFQ